MTYNQLKKDDINIELKQRKLEMIGDYTNTKTPTEFICYICNKHFIAKYEHVKKLKHEGCPKCSKLFAMNQKHKSAYKFRLAKMQDMKSDSLKVLDYNLELNEARCLCLLCNQEFVTSYESVCMGSMHKSCASKISNKNKRLSVQEIETRIKQRGYNLKLQESEDDDNYLMAHCNVCGYDWRTLREPLCNKGGCPICCKNKRRMTRIKKHKNQCIDFLNSLGLEMVGDFNGKSKPTIVKCESCGNQFNMNFNYQFAHLSGCPYCKRDNHLKDKFLSFSQSLKNNNSHIKIVGEYLGAERDTTFYCEICEQYFITTPHDLSKKWNCPNCTTNSVLESKTKQFILDKGLAFETHKRFKGLQGINGGLLSYDFYLPQIKTLIECQGIQHIKPIELFGGETQFKIQKEHDKRKREYALNNGYTFVEIFYYDINNIHNILNKIVKTGGE